MKECLVFSNLKQPSVFYLIRHVLSLQLALAHIHIHTWFLEIAFVHDVSILVCVCVCPRPQGYKLHSHDIAPVQPVEQVCCA